MATKNRKTSDGERKIVQEFSDPFEVFSFSIFTQNENHAIAENKSNRCDSNLDSIRPMEMFLLSCDMTRAGSGKARGGGEENIGK